MGTEQLNVEYFFRLLYDLFFGARAGFDFTAFKELLSYIWLWVTVIGYGLALGGLFVIVFATTRLFELRRREAEYYSTLLVTERTSSEASPRWEHIQSLVEGGRPSEWREAITEADIMLDDVLAENGIVGDTVGDKLRGAHFATIKEAGEAHGIRNKIAHQGSAFELSETLAHRTIQNYEAVFREFNAI